MTATDTQTTTVQLILLPSGQYGAVERTMSYDGIVISLLLVMVIIVQFITLARQRR